MNEQFELVYHGHFSYSDTESMVTAERRWFHDRLIKQKNEIEAKKPTDQPTGPPPTAR